MIVHIEDGTPFGKGVTEKIKNNREPIYQLLVRR